MIRHLPTKVAIEAAEWLRKQNLPDDKWFLAPDLCNFRFEITRRYTGIYEIRWFDDGSTTTIH